MCFNEDLQLPFHLHGRSHKLRNNKSSQCMGCINRVAANNWRYLTIKRLQWKTVVYMFDMITMITYVNIR